MPKPYIDTIRGRAYFLKTCTENKYGNWDDHWATIRGEFVIHEGKKHHVYTTSPRWKRRKTKIPEWEKGDIILAVDHERLSKEDKTKVWKVSTGNKEYCAYKLLRYFDNKKDAMNFIEEYMKRY